MTKVGLLVVSFIDDDTGHLASSEKYENVERLVLFSLRIMNMHVMFS